MRKLVKTVVVIVMMLMVCAVNAAGDAAAGKTKAMICAACHGPDGISTNDIWPNLAGQKQGYLIKQMKAFRDGTRTDPSMSPMAKPLSDQDIENLAAYFNSMK